MSDPTTPDPAEPAPAPPTADELRRQEETEEAGQALVFLSQHRRGRLALEFARAVRDLIKAVRKHQKAGSVTVKIEVKPIKGAMPGSVNVVDSVVLKAPTGERPATTMFTTPDDWLTRDHPDQYAAFNVIDQSPGGQK